MNLTTKNLLESTRDFAQSEIAAYAAKWDAEEAVSREHIQKIADAGYFGMTFPQEYGGKGLSALEAVQIIEEVGKYCTISARLIVDHNFGAVGTILNFGTEEQRQRVLPAIARGEKLMSIGMTEPEAGSALTDLSTSAILDGDAYVIKGDKRWITGGGEREYTLIYARFDGIEGADGIGAILVEDDTDGYIIGDRIPTMGVRGVRESNLHYENARVPVANLVVPAGSGFKKLMSAYNGQRVAASAVALGIAQGALDYAVAYADNRQQFGQRITDFQGIQFEIAELTLEIEAMRSLIYRAAKTARQTITARYESSLAKAYSAKKAVHVVSAAMQLMGGNGYSREHPIERMYRDVRMFGFGGGTSEIQKIGIASHVLKRPLPQHKV